MTHSYYSQRMGLGPHPSGMPLEDVIDLFVRMYEQLDGDGYFQEAFGFVCVDAGPVPGTVRDPDLAILLGIRKRDLWPVRAHASDYSEDDLFDMIEFLFQHVSKPTEGNYHSWNDCGMHWSKFHRLEGQTDFREKINIVLGHYEHAFELSQNGEVLRKPEEGLSPFSKRKFLRRTPAFKKGSRQLC